MLGRFLYNINIIHFMAIFICVWVFLDQCNTPISSILDGNVSFLRLPELSVSIFSISIFNQEQGNMITTYILSFIDPNPIRQAFSERVNYFATSHTLINFNKIQFWLAVQYSCKVSLSQPYRFLFLFNFWAPHLFANLQDQSELI